MTFDYNEENKTLIVSTDDGRVMKYVFMDGQVGKLFNLILLQLENASGGGGSTVDVAEWAKADNSDKIPEEKIPDMFDNVDVVSELPETGVQDRIYIVTGGDNAGKRYYWNGAEFAEMPDEGGITIGTVAGTAYDGGKGTELETKVTDLEASVADKLGTLDVAAWAKAEDPTTIPLEKMDENVVEYSDFSYVPSGETEPVPRKTIQLKNYDSISGLNTTGNDAANLIMMSKWDKVDIGSSRYPVNLNGSEFTLNDEKTIATTDQIPSVEGLATEEFVTQKIGEIQIPDISDLTANVSTVGESVQIGQEVKGLNLKTSGDVYSGAMVNSEGYIPTMTPYPGESGRYVLQMRNHDSLSGVSTDGATGGNLVMLSKYDVADYGSKNFHTNLNVKEDNGHNGRVTVNDDNEIAYLSDINEVFELNGLTELQTGASSESIQTALGVDFETLVSTISESKLIIVDRNSAGDYKACIHATGNISSGNGGANLMFFVGTVPTIFEVQYVSGTFALYVAEYEFAKKSDIPDTSGFATTQSLSDSIAAEASARNKAIETATSDLVHNTTTVAGKSLTGNITLASADLTDGTELAKKDEILDTVVNETNNETLRQALTVRTHLPFARMNDLTNQTEAQIYALFNESVTDRASLRNYIQSNMAYIAYNLDSAGQHQYYKLPILLASIPDTGDITVIAMAADIYNSDKLSKFTYTITLNGDSSSVHIEKKALES